MVVLRTDFIKCVVIGDDAVGKTSLLVCYATNKFPETQHLPSVFDNYAGRICISGKRYHLQLIDTLEQVNGFREDSDTYHFRFLNETVKLIYITSNTYSGFQACQVEFVSYFKSIGHVRNIDPCSDITRNVFPGTDVFVVCFSAVRPESFNNAEKKWIPSIKQRMGDTPFILVNTQTDLRKDDSVVQELRRNGRCPITKLAGAAMARRLGASSYIECSPGDQKNMTHLINNAIVSVLRPNDFKMEGQSCTIL